MIRGLSGVFLKTENFVPSMGAKRSGYIEKLPSSRKEVYFLLSRDQGKGDLIATWEHV